jgi:hypothetical protein
MTNQPGPVKEYSFEEAVARRLAELRDTPHLETFVDGVFDEFDCYDNHVSGCPGRAGGDHIEMPESEKRALWGDR